MRFREKHPYVTTSVRLLGYLVLLRIFVNGALAATGVPSDLSNFWYWVILVSIALLLSPLLEWALYPTKQAWKREKEED